MLAQQNSRLITGRAIGTGPACICLLRESDREGEGEREREEREAFCRIVAELKRLFPHRTMRKLAAQLSPYLCRRKLVNVQSRNFSSSSFRKDEHSIEEEAERKIGWFLKLLFAGTATVIAYQLIPYMGDNLLQQSVSLLQVKDPLFKRMGASRLSSFAIDDERRKKIVEMGGAEELLNMLGAAKDDRTRKEALKALVALSPSDEAVGFLHRGGAVSVIRSTPDSSEDAEIAKYKSSLLNRFQDLRFDSS